MSAVATAIVGGAVIGAVGTGMAANSASKAQQHAADVNLQATNSTNALNKQMFDESRGSTGSSVLPLYLKDYEATLGSQAARNSQTLLNYGGGSSGRLASATQNIGQYLPLISAGNSYLTNLYNGNLLASRRAAFQPLGDARVAAARDAASAIDQSIYGNIGRMDADAASRGFVGGSTFDRNRALMATIGARLSAQQQLSQARTQNAQDLYGLNESNVQMQQQNLDQPFTRATNSVNLMYAPIDTEARVASNAMNPMSFFRIGTNAFQYERPPLQQPILGGGAIAGAGMGQIGSALMNYGMSRGIANAYGGSGSGVTLYPGASGVGAATDGELLGSTGGTLSMMG